MRTKDLTSLLQLLQVSERSGLLTVEPPELSEGEQWQGQFLLTQGNVRSCLIRSKGDGRVLLQGADALRWLTRQGRLEWWMEEQTASVDPPASRALPPPSSAQRPDSIVPVPPRQTAGIPRRTPQGIASKGSEAWPRDYRHVLSLVDGRRGPEEIGRMLGKPVKSIERILRDLVAAGFVE